MELHVLDHPLVEHKLTVLRDKNTSSATFRELVTELVMLEAYEATRNLDIVDKPIETPVAPMVGKHIASPAPIIVPVLRAGLGMLDGMTKMIPTAEVGFLGMKRDEEHPTQQITYANRLPEDLTGRQCFLIDPMLATGGTLVAATHPKASPPPTTSPSAAPKTSPPSTSSPPPKASNTSKTTSTPPSPSRSSSAPSMKDSTKRRTLCRGLATPATASTASLIDGAYTAFPQRSTYEIRLRR